MNEPMGRRPIVSIHQPHYFPWLGLITKIAASDIFVFLDNVQFEKNGWQNRGRYSATEGLKFLTIPVKQKNILSGQVTIADIEIADTEAPRRHWTTLRQRYGKRPGWKIISERLEEILAARHEKLISLCLATTKLTLDIFHVERKILFASQMQADGKKTERVVNLTKAAGGRSYLSGLGAKSYLVTQSFEDAALNLLFHEFVHPAYQQSAGVKFQPGAFALEWFIEDPEGSTEFFQSHFGGREPGAR